MHNVRIIDIVLYLVIGTCYMAYYAETEDMGNGRCRITSVNKGGARFEEDFPNLHKRIRERSMCPCQRCVPHLCPAHCPKCNKSYRMCPHCDGYWPADAREVALSTSTILPYTVVRKVLQHCADERASKYEDECIRCAMTQ